MFMSSKVGTLIRQLGSEALILCVSMHSRIEPSSDCVLCFSLSFVDTIFAESVNECIRIILQDRVALSQLL